MIRIKLQILIKRNAEMILEIQMILLKSLKRVKMKFKYILKVLEINKSCSNKKYILIHFTNQFLKFIQNFKKTPKQDYFVTCYELRNIISDYYNIANILLLNKTSPIKKETKNFIDAYEFGILLIKK